MILAKTSLQGGKAEQPTVSVRRQVLGAVGMREVMLDLGPRFEHATGHTLAMTFDASGVIVVESSPVKPSTSS